MATTTTQYAIMRHQKLRTLDDVRIASRHNDRTLPPTHAKTGHDTQPKTLLGPDNHMAVMRLLGEKTSRLRKKPRAGTVPAVEVLLTASPEWFQPTGRGGWNPKKVADFERHVVDFCKKEYGENLLQAVVHYDETTPHVHVITMPVMDNRLCCKEWMSKRRLQEMQTRWAEDVKPLGLVRGRKNSKLTHSELSDFYTAFKTPLPQLKPKPVKPKITLADRVKGRAEAKLATYDKQMTEWTKHAQAYSAGLKAKARAVDVVLPDLKKREGKIAHDQQAASEAKAKYEDLAVVLQGRLDLDTRSRMNIIKALPRDFLANVLGVELPGKADAVDVLRRAGRVKNMDEGVTYIFEQLAAFGQQREVTPPKPPEPPELKNQPSVAFGISDTLLSNP